MKYLLLVLIISLTYGCATNIADLPITPRDQEVYENPYLKGTSEEGQSALRVAIVPEGKVPDSDPVGKKLSGNFYDSLDAALTQLKDFEPVPRAEIGAVMNEASLNELTSGEKADYKVAKVDYLLVYKIQNFSMKPVPLFENKYKGAVNAKVTLINSAHNVKEFTKTFSAESDSSSSSNDTGNDQSQNTLTEACDSIVKQFVAQFAIDYSPHAVVQQTKGEGRVALLNVGSKNGVTKGVQVEFFTIKQKGEQKLYIPFAYGTVLDLDENTSWVEVENYKDAGVKENHFARIRKIQSKSFLDKVSGNVPNPLQ